MLKLREDRCVKGDGVCEVSNEMSVSDPENNGVVSVAEFFFLRENC